MLTKKVNSVSRVRVRRGTETTFRKQRNEGNRCVKRNCRTNAIGSGWVLYPQIHRKVLTVTPLWFSGMRLMLLIVRLANLMKVLTSDAVQDPTRVEARVRREVAMRKHTHEKMNAERKLTDDQRKEKIENKKLEAEKRGIYGAIFR